MEQEYIHSFEPACCTGFQEFSVWRLSIWSHHTENSCVSTNAAMKALVVRAEDSTSDP